MNWAVESENFTFPLGFALEAGTYDIEFTISDYSAGTIKAGLGNATVGYNWSAEFTTDGTKTFQLSTYTGCEATSCIFVLSTLAFGFTGKIDNLTISG